jgi:hypothetical protein
MSTRLALSTLAMVMSGLALAASTAAAGDRLTAVERAWLMKAASQARDQVSNWDKETLSCVLAGTRTACIHGAFERFRSRFRAVEHRAQRYAMRTRGRCRRSLLEVAYTARVITDSADRLEADLPRLPADVWSDQFDDVAGAARAIRLYTQVSLRDC